MRITAFNGSHRGERGNTHWMVNEFLAGAAAGGAEVENILLVNHEIQPCRACYSCWTTKEGCPQKDDMEGLLQKYLSSDVVLFATPLYVDNVTALMKVFFDRLIATGDPHMEKDPQGECRHVAKHPKPTKLAVIATCGFPEQSHFQVLELLFRRMARNLHLELVSEIYRGASALLTCQTPELKPFVEAYRELLRRAGSELAAGGSVSPVTKEALAVPIFPNPDFVDQFIMRANKMWDGRIQK